MKSLGGDLKSIRSQKWALCIYHFVNIAYRDGCGRAGVGSFSQKGVAIPLPFELCYYLAARQGKISLHEGRKRAVFRSHRNLPRRCKSRKAQPRRDPGKEKLHFTSVYIYIYIELEEKRFRREFPTREFITIPCA